MLSALVTNTSWWRKVFQPEQATGLANCKWEVNVKMWILGLFFYYYYFILLPILKIFQMMPFCVGTWWWVTMTQTFAVAVSGWWVSRPGAQPQQQSQTAVLWLRARPLPTRHTARWGLGLAWHGIFISVQCKKPQCRLCLVPGTAAEHKGQENKEIAFMSYFLGLCWCHSKVEERGLFTQRRQD